MRRGLLPLVATAAGVIGFLAGREIWPRERLVGRVIRVEVPSPPSPPPRERGGPGGAGPDAAPSSGSPGAEPKSEWDPVDIALSPRMKVELKGEEPVLRPHGPWSEHHPNGRVKTQGEFIDGNPAGAWRTFREDGSLAREVRYRDGKLDGEEVVWHGNGVVGMRGTWKDGAREGLFTYWDEEGSLVREEELKGGEISAPIRLFDPKGEFPPEAEALAKAAVDGKYRNLLRKIAAPDDKGSYGDFRDYGYWRGSSYLGHADLGEGHWVYVYPYWYVWAEKVE